MAERAERTGQRAPMDEHPDVVALQQQYGQNLGTPQTVVGEGVLALAGVWAAISPWIIGFVNPTMVINNLVVGLVVAAIGLGLTGVAERSAGLSWVAIPLGVWLIIAMWITPLVTPTLGMVWSNVVTGAVVVLFGAGVAGTTLAKLRQSS